MEKIISATEFMQQKSAPKRSKLTPFQNDILLLKQNGYTDAQVLEFLAMNGIKVAQSTLNQFIRNKMQNANLKTATTTPIASTPEPTANIQEKPSPPVRRGLRRPAPTEPFNWDNKRNPESLK